MKKLLLIDGHNLLFRMFYGLPYSVTSKEGKEAKGVVGFVGSMIKLIKQFEPNHLVVAFDCETSTASRLSDYEDYKQNRIDYSDLPEDEIPFNQLPYIYKALNHLGIQHFEATDHEADDYLASYALKYKDECEVTIISTDKDFLQLVDDNVTVYNPVGKTGTRYTPDKVFEKFQIHPEQMVEFKSLVGDASDNISGVKSIGPKTAVKILKHGVLMDILDNKTDLEGKLLSKLMANEDIIKRNISLITMICDIEIEDNLIDISDFDTNLKTMVILKECGIL